jgi:signal transduction histidine kinase
MSAVLMRISLWTMTVAAVLGLLGAVVIAAAASDSGLVVWVAVGVLPFLALAVYLFWRRPHEPTARQLLVTALAAMAIPAALEAIVKSGGPGERSMWVALAVHQVLTAIGIAAATVMIGLFPSGRTSGRAERIFVRVSWSLPVGVLALVVASPIVPVSAFSFPDHGDIPNPMPTSGLTSIEPLARVATQLVVVAFVAGMVLLIRRYRRTEVLRRRQIRWVVYSAGAAVMLSALPWTLGEMGIAPGLTHGVLAVIGVVPMLMLPASIVIGLLQPAWIDTDAVIRRSAAFAVLSAAVLVVYASLAAAFGVAAGRRMPVELAILVTVVVAIAFHPARMRLQRAVDRWVYGDQPTRFDAVVGFERAIHDATGVTDLATGLADTARSALRLLWAEVEIPPEPPHVSGPETGQPILEVPIRHRDEILGSIRCGPSARRLSDADTELLATLAAQTGLALFSSRLATRVVQAQEAERRRIERNIHDGAQQELVALVAKLGLARSRAARGNLEEALLVELQSETTSILRELRTLAQGIHPSVLTDGGLVEAVRDRCGRFPISITVDASSCLDGERFDDDVEGAAYFFVTEALANVLKHSNATNSHVSIEHVGRFLEVSISDDGVGFDPESVRRNGLAGLSDRVSALSGTVTVTAAPGAGTVLLARLPAGVAHP